MEDRIRILIERDRQTLLWLRTHVGDARLSTAIDVLTRGEAKPYVSALCRYLGVRPPTFSGSLPRTPASSEVGDRYLTQIRAHLARNIYSRAR
ncbi:hypothetical protein N0A02_32985 (plasmid) [Paraburkholderia acidicola]|uniref:HTH araC/xylS-type domain-containing protein n=1 Tax=Paraburkholderia acidicola TaxID=1912599 RepID=A0ABV1LYC6_9BURK